MNAVTQKTLNFSTHVKKLLTGSKIVALFFLVLYALKFVQRQTYEVVQSVRLKNEIFNFILMKILILFPKKFGKNNFWRH